MNTLVYTCGYGENFFRYAKMLMHTIRFYNYQGDCLIFTNVDGQCKDSRVINVDQHPDKDLMKSGRRMTFHSGVAGFDISKFPYDYFSCKYLPGSFVCREDYDFILYLDSDILLTNNIDSIFNYKCVVGDYGPNLYFNLKGLKKYFLPQEVMTFNNIVSVGGGAVGVPRSMYSFYEDYRDTYLKYINEIPHDQPALAMCLYQNRKKYQGKPLPHNAYWKHYWGSWQKKNMMLDFQRRFPDIQI